MKLWKKWWFWVIVGVVVAFLWPKVLWLEGERLDIEPKLFYLRDRYNCFGITLPNCRTQYASTRCNPLCMGIPHGKRCYIVEVIPGGSNKEEIDCSVEFPTGMKYCNVDSDCETACGGAIGRGNCFNKRYVSFPNPPEDVCCPCEIAGPCNYCKCVDNECVTLRYEGDKWC